MPPRSSGSQDANQADIQLPLPAGSSVSLRVATTRGLSAPHRIGNLPMNGSLARSMPPTVPLMRPTELRAPFTTCVRRVSAWARSVSARLMRHAGTQGASRRRRWNTTKRDPQAEVVDDLVCRNFTAVAPNELWVSDITYTLTYQGLLFPSVLMDAWSWPDHRLVDGSTPTY